MTRTPPGSSTPRSWGATADRRGGLAGSADDRGRATGSNVSLVLLPPDGQIPVAIRLGTSDAQQAHDKIRGAGVILHNDELVRMEAVPAMFSFTDPDGNGLVYLEDADPSEPH